MCCQAALNYSCRRHMVCYAITSEGELRTYTASKKGTVQPLTRLMKPGSTTTDRGLRKYINEDRRLFRSTNHDTPTVHTLRHCKQVDDSATYILPRELLAAVTIYLV